MERKVLSAIFLLLFAGLIHAQPSSPTLDKASYSLGEGWNSVSFPSENIDFESFRQKAEENGCNLVDSDGKYLWRQTEDTWEKENTIDHGEAYYIFTEFECSFVMDQEVSYEGEFTVEESETDRFVLKRIPSSIDFGEIIDRCGLVENDEGYTTWVQRGGSPVLDLEPNWEHPLEQNSFNPTQGVYIYPESDCSITIDEEESDSETSSSDDTESSDNDETSSDDSSEEIPESSSELDVPSGWSYEGEVEPERFGVNSNGVMILEAEKCGKIYYQKQFDKGEKLEFDIGFNAENWEGLAGVWHTDSDGDLVLDDQSIDRYTVQEPSDLDLSGTIEFTQGANGSVQIGLSADPAICDEVGNAELRVNRVDNN